MTLLEELSDDELEQLAVDAAAEYSPELWLTRVLPAYVFAQGDETVAEAEALFSPHHHQFWQDRKSVV